MKKQILFVDDERSLLDGLRRSLRHRRKEWEMSFFTSGKEALESIQTKHYDALVTDMKMSGMDGAELLSAVAESRPAMVRIILSGQADNDMTFRSVMNAHQYLPKPCDTRQLEQALDNPFTFRQYIGADNVSAFVAGMKTIPTIPSVYLEITRKLSQEDTTVKDIGHIIAQDPAMTAKILQMVNSAFFGLGRKVSDPGEAAVILGLDTIKTLVLSIGIFSQLESYQQDLSIEKLKEHSTRTGALATRIAKAENRDKDFQNRCALAGFLHDLGILILATNIPERYQQVLATADQDNQSLATAEAEALSITHSEVGAYLLSLWGFPIEIVEAVVFHHTPEQAPDSDFSPLTALYVADQLTPAYPDTGYHEDVLSDSPYLQKLGMTERIDQWRELASATAEETSD